MNRLNIKLILLLLFICSGRLILAQTFPMPRYFQQLFSRPDVPADIPGPVTLHDHVVDGKLQLNLRDSIQLTLLNNTQVKLSRLQYDLSLLSVGRPFSVFDPALTSRFTATRSESPTTSTLEGAQVLSTLSHLGSVGFTQMLQTGTTLNVNLSSNRNSTNSSFVFINPSYFSSMNVSVSQPLLRGRGLLVNRAPIIIAQRNLKQSEAAFETQLTDSVSQAINQYWDVVQARKELDVLRESLKLAEASYAKDQRALELGALPPLDIFRSETQVAQRRLQVIQSEFRLKQLEETYRRSIGADLDPATAHMELELTEGAVGPEDFLTVDLEAGVASALNRRPEIRSLRQQLSIDDLNAKVANNSMKPNLTLSGSYTTNGRSGNEIDYSTGSAVIASTGGLWDSIRQLGRFDTTAYGFTLDLRLPFKNRAAAIDLGTAIVSKKRDLYQLRQLEQSLSLEVNNAFLNLEQTKMSVTASKKYLDLAKKTLAAEQRKYELGAQTIFFVLDAQSQLAVAEQGLLQAEIGYQRAVTALDRSTANLLDRYQIQLEKVAP